LEVGRLLDVVQWIALALLVSATSALATEGPTLRVRAARTDTPPVIDGRLTEPAWSAAGYIDHLRQKLPVAYDPASQQTEIRILYDADYLYLAIRAHEEDPTRIIASKMVRDGNMSSDDRIAISLDTFLDQRNGYHFEINPLGNKRDGLIENGAASFEWDGIWFASARVDAQGYVVEVAIPFQTLSIARDRSTWGLQIVRYTKRNGEEDRWSHPTPEIGSFNMSGNGRLEGLVGIRQGLGLDVVPKFAISHVDDGVTNATDTDIDPGLDAFYRITPSLTGALTVNTDFGEAEVDSRQVNLTRFSLFFPEKRQFFLQDSGIFDFGGLQRNPLPFFSRRIGLSDQGEEIPILVGSKVTGRVGPLNVGLLDVVTDEYERQPDDGAPAEKIGVRNLAVARMSLNVLEESTAGVIVTHGNPNSDEDNFLVGADMNYRTSRFLDDRTLIARGWAQKSKTSGINSDQFAWGTRLAYPNDRVNWYLIAEGVQDNFNPALGFTSRTGIRSYYAGYRLRERPERSVRTLDRGVSGFLVTSTDNDFESARIALEPFTVETPAGDAFAVRYQHVFEDLDTDFDIRDDISIPIGRYDWSRYILDAQSSNGRPISLGLTTSFGGFFDGHRWDLQPRLAWRPSRFFVVKAKYQRNDVSLPSGNFVVHIASLIVDVQFTPRLSWNSFIQFDSDSDNIGINTRLRWIIEPGREFFLILNQGIVIDGDDWKRGETEPRAKIGWTFRF